MTLVQLVAIALLVESVWETAKMIWQEGKFSIERLGVMVLGIVVCIAASLDIFVMVQIPLNIPFLGACLTGIIVSRGANFMHDLVGLIGKTYQETKS